MSIESLTEVQIAYLAGLTDGEGSLECQKEHQPKGVTPRFVLRLSFCFATPEPLQTISGWLGAGVRTYPATGPTRSPRHRMHVTKSIAVPLLRRMLPHLILKRREAELVLAIETVRAAHSPSRRTGVGAHRRMPETALAQMDNHFRDLRALKSNKRRLDARVNRAA